MDNYRVEISGLLKPLSSQKQLVFGALICEKLYPNYEYFSRITSYGNSNLIRDAISIIYQNAIENKLSSINEIKNLIDAIELITPDTEDFEEILVSFALDACTCILSTLNFILDKEIENIVDTAIYARDTVDMYIKERDNMPANDKDIEAKIEQDIYMQREKQRQRMVIKSLAEITKITDIYLEFLRQIQPHLIIDLNALS